ncbi:VOC family protein [Lutibacter sp.]|uniref:VOC family protein n=1 Tax=Lutibacter sp. TaxID=1925666 RepID=UPI002734FFCD|nr:VOC family protein [Lutibacter sp.]MDP3313987.1 VOC family protein [Lutibacter sp.]
MKSNIGCWFEIPVENMDRAVKFYETVFNFKINVQNFGELLMGWFPLAEDKNAPNTGGSLIYNPTYYKPGTNGTLIYLASQTNDVSDELGRVEAAGGKVIVSKKIISEEIGYMGAFIDSEGNRIAVHSTI